MFEVANFTELLYINSTAPLATALSIVSAPVVLNLISLFLIFKILAEPITSPAKVAFPVNDGEANGAFSPMLVAVVVAKLGSSPSAAASSFNVFNVAGELSTKFDICVPT